MNRPKEFLAWAVGVFGPIALDRTERLARFVEEAIELAHAEDMPRDKLDRIIERVYDRERGPTFKEIGQAQATLECFAECLGMSADREATLEFDRVRSLSKEHWSLRHAAKVKLGIAND